MKRYIKNVLLILIIMVAFVASNVYKMPDRMFSYTYALAEKYVFSTKEEVPTFTVGRPVLVPATKSDGTKYDQMYINKLGEIRVPITGIANVPSKNDFNVKVTRNNIDVTRDFIITKTDIKNKSMTITLTMKEGTTYNASSYVVSVSVSHEWEEEKIASTTKASRVKLIRNESIGNIAYSTQATSDWNKSSLQAILNGRYYNATGAYDSIGLTEESKYLMSRINWNIGGNENSYRDKASDFYSGERSNANSDVWQGNVGLIYPSDFGYAVGGSNRSQCLNIPLNLYERSCSGGVCPDDYLGSDALVCSNDDWLAGDFLWTMTPSASMMYQINYVARNLVTMTSFLGTYGIKPVVYLDTDVAITGGSGTTSNPYTLGKSSSTTNNLVNKINTLAKTDKTNLLADGTTDNNIRYVGKNPNNYVRFNGELWRIIGVMNNIEGNDGENLEAKNNTIKKTTSFALVDKYYNFEGNIETLTDYRNNPSNKVNKWEITLGKFEEIDSSKFQYTLTGPDGKDYTNSPRFTIETKTSNNTQKVYTIKNSKYIRPKAGTYTFTVSYSNSSVSNSRGTLTKRFNILVGGREVVFTEAAPVESHRYVRTPSTELVSLDVNKLTDTSITFYEDKIKKTMTITEFNKIYSGTTIENIRKTDDGDVVFAFIQNDKNYFIYRLTSTHVYYIDPMSEEKDVNGNIINHFEATVDDFERAFPNQLSTLASSSYAADSTGDIYCVSKANKSITLITLESENRIINAGGGGIFKYKYIYSGLEEKDLKENLTYKIFRTTGKEVTAKEGFSVKNMSVNVVDEENGYFNFTLDYNNTDELYIGEYYIRFYINDGNETITKDVGFSLFEGEIDYYVRHHAGIEAKNSNKQIEHYIAFYLKKGSTLSKTMNAHSIGVKIYDSLADLEENGDIYYYDLVNYELRLLNKKDNIVKYQVFENNVEVSGSPFTSTIDEFKKSKYSQAAELLDYYKFDSATGNLITDSTNFKENDKTSIEVISASYSETLQDQVLKYKENGIDKEATYTQFKTTHPNMYGYLFINFVFDENGNILTGRLMGNYRDNERNKTGHDVTDQFNIIIDQNGDDLEKAITILPKTEVLPQTYYVYVSYENLIGVGHLNDDPDSLITKNEFPDMWKQNTHMTMMGFDNPEYSIALDNPHLTNEGDANDIIYDNIEGKATFDLTISDTFKFENKFSYAIYYHDTSDGKSGDDVNWGSPIQTSTSANKRFNVTSDLFSMIEREELEPYKTTLSVETIKGIAHPKGEYKIVLSYSNNGVTNTGEQTFKIDGKYYGLVLDKEKTDKLEYIRNYTETKNIVFDGYYIGNYDNINISMIQENSSGDIELTRTATDNISGKFSFDGEDRFTYQIIRQKIDDDHSVYTFKLTNIKDKSYEAQYHLRFKYKEDGGDETTTVVDFVVNPASYIWAIDEKDIPTANGKILSFTKDINTTYIEDLNQFNFVVMGFNGTKYEDVSSDEAKNKEFESVELINKECSGLECSAKVKITLKEDTDKNKDYYLVSEYLKKDDETDISNLEELFAWDIANVRITGSYYDPNENRDHIVDGFFKNVEDTTIDITLNTVQTGNINWELNRECLTSGYACEVNSDSVKKYNDFLTEVQNGNKHLKLRVNAEYLKAHSDELKVQNYSLVLYYGENDYRIYKLEVHGNYVLVKFGDSLIYSTTNAGNGVKNVDGLFKNKNGFIHAPVTLVGIGYDDPGISIKLTNANGDVDYLGRPFEFNKDEFISTKAIDVKYLASSADIAVSQDYLLTISYDNGEETFEDNLEFRLNEKYFNYEISAPTYDPNPLIPNNGGKIKFRVTTEDIPNIQFGPNSNESLSEKYKMMRDAVILDNTGNDVTSKFTKSVANAEGNNTFDLTLSFAAGAVDPGDYTLRMAYELEDLGYVLTKEKDFSIGNYAKELEISRVEIISTTTDGRIHKNVDGTYRLHYESAYNISPGHINVKVFSGENDVTNKFAIAIQEQYIDIKYSASTNLDAGDYNVVITYQDDDMEVATTVNQGIKLYGIYKQIDITNLKSSGSTILADKENQYYTFEVNKQPIIDDINNLKWLITNASGEDVTNQFKVTNNLNTDENNFKIDIVPFASPVGEYYVRLYLLPDGVSDIDEERMYSNTLAITIDDTYYKVNLNNTSTLTQVKNYDANDKTSIYDRDGAKGDYHFTSTYPIDDLSKYSVAITDVNGKVLKKLDGPFINQEGTLSVKFNTGALANIGDYKVMICINNLPYIGLNMKVVKFIPATKVTLRINNANVGSTYAAHSNTTYNTSFVVEPSNATNKNFTLTSSNTNIATISGTSITTNAGGSSTITLTNGDISATTVFNVTDYLTSSVYTIDQTNHTVFVSTMTKKQLSKSDFIKNLKGYTSYQILDASNKDITSSTTLIGTNMSIKVSGVSYKIIVIGDVNGDGKITNADITQLHRHVRGTTKIKNQYQLKAAAINKRATISNADTTKLFRYVRNTITKI